MSSFLNGAFRPFFAAVVLIQGIHVIEHIIQLIQVYVLGIPDDFALGLLGYVFQVQGTEEWLHLVFNVSYLLALLLILAPLRRFVSDTVPRWAYTTFLFAVALEGWHNVEHAVIISNVIANSGCPCPGIGDVALGVTDTVLHFFYNLVAYGATLPAFWFFWRNGPSEELRIAPAG